MKKTGNILMMSMAVAALHSCGNGGIFDPDSVQDAGNHISRVEPLSWWTGMKTPLQLMVYGEGIGEYDVRIEGADGVEVQCIRPTVRTTFSSMWSSPIRLSRVRTGWFSAETVRVSNILMR